MAVPTPNNNPPIPLSTATFLPRCLLQNFVIDSVWWPGQSAPIFTGAILQYNGDLFPQNSIGAQTLLLTIRHQHNWKRFTIGDNTNWAIMTLSAPDTVTGLAPSPGTFCMKTRISQSFILGLGGGTSGVGQTTLETPILQSQLQGVNIGPWSYTPIWYQWYYPPTNTTGLYNSPQMVIANSNLGRLNYIPESVLRSLWVKRAWFTGDTYGQSYFNPFVIVVNQQSSNTFTVTNGRVTQVLTLVPINQLAPGTFCIQTTTGQNVKYLYNTLSSGGSATSPGAQGNILVKMSTHPAIVAQWNNYSWSNNNYTNAVTWVNPALNTRLIPVSKCFPQAALMILRVVSAWIPGAPNYVINTNFVNNFGPVYIISQISATTFLATDGTYIGIVLLDQPNPATFIDTNFNHIQYMQPIQAGRICIMSAAGQWIRSFGFTTNPNTTNP